MGVRGGGYVLPRPQLHVALAGSGLSAGSVPAARLLAVAPAQHPAFSRVGSAFPPPPQPPQAPASAHLCHPSLVPTTLPTLLWPFSSGNPMNTPLSVPYQDPD